MTPPPVNLRHLRLLIALADTGSVTAASQAAHLTQPAVTQALARQESAWGGPLFTRQPGRLFATDRGAILLRRVRRAFALLDPPLSRVSARLPMTASASQLRALIAVADHESNALAARHLGLAQPTVHRAIATLEAEAGAPLFRRQPHGVTPTRECSQIALAARLAFAELVQARAEISAHDGQDAATITLGALPLSRSVILPPVLIAFQRQRPAYRFSVVEGGWDEMTLALRRGEIDLMLGALRPTLSGGDLRQETLFDDQLAVVCGPDHPLASLREAAVARLAGQDWVVARPSTPTRDAFDAAVRDSALAPGRIIETASPLLMREILNSAPYLGCLSATQAEVEIRRDLLIRIGTLPAPPRPIGITTRADWLPTEAQRDLIAMIRDRFGTRP